MNLANSNFEQHLIDVRCVSFVGDGDQFKLATVKWDSTNLDKKKANRKTQIGHHFEFAGPSVLVHSAVFVLL